MGITGHTTAFQHDLTMRWTTHNRKVSVKPGLLIQQLLFSFLRLFKATAHQLVSSAAIFHHMVRASILAFYGLWFVVWFTGLFLTALNINWKLGGTTEQAYGAAYVTCVGFLLLSVSEEFVRTIFTIFCGACDKRSQLRDPSNMLLCINYNLLVRSANDIMVTIEMTLYLSIHCFAGHRKGGSRRGNGQHV